MNIKTRFTTILGLSLLLNHPLAIAESSDNQDLFKTVLLQLQKKTKVTPILPTYLASEGETEPLYATLESITKNRYDIELAFVPECHTATACHYGTLIGKVNKKLPPLKGQRVKLSKGLTGYFVDAKCGANCSDSTLTWVQKGHRYTVGIKAGRKTDLIKVANSAILNYPTPPAKVTAGKFDSVYTKLSRKACKIQEEDPDEGYTMSCPGIAGYRLSVHGLEHSDMHSMSVSVIAPNRKEYPLQFESRASQRFEQPLGDKVEWRVTKTGKQKTPVAIIIRSNLQEETDDGVITSSVASYLIVSKLTTKEICVVNRIKTSKDANQQARTSADKAAKEACLK
jgi:hypothetical protein